MGDRGRVNFRRRQVTTLGSGMMSFGLADRLSFGPDLQSGPVGQSRNL